MADILWNWMNLNRILKSTLLIFWALLCTYGAKGQVLINEFQASNTSDFQDISLGNYPDWIELYNAGPSTVDLGGYFLSDNAENPEKWEIPQGILLAPGAHFIFFSDGLDFGIHTSFKLSSNGEAVVFSDPSGVIQDMLDYPEQLSDMSYGRKEDGSNDWGYFFDSSPRSSNAGVFSESALQADAPNITVPGGFFEGSVQVELEAGTFDQIHYTLDGSEPCASSPLYGGAITLSQTSVLRARVFNLAGLPGKVRTETYFIGTENRHQLPVIAISMAPDDLWNDTSGVMQQGFHYDGNDPLTSNYHKDWQKPANFEYFDVDGQQQVNMTLEYELTGQIRGYGLKSFRLNARSKYDHDVIAHDFFPHRKLQEFSSLVVRHGGWPDLESSLLRDGLIQTIAGRTIDIDYQEYQPTIVYYNGEYFGILNLREKINTDFLAQNHGVDAEKIDLLENDAAVIDGFNGEYKALQDVIANQDITDDSIYQSVVDQLDLDEYLNYQITQIYAANTDWPGKNIKYWKEQGAEGKWRWIIFDTDFGYGMNGQVDHRTLRWLHGTAEETVQGSAASTFMLRRLLENEHFRADFVQRFAVLLNTHFSTPSALAHHDRLVAAIEPEIAAHAERWGYFTSKTHWDQRIAETRNFAEFRPIYLFQYLVNFFQLRGTHRLELRANDPIGGQLYINSIAVSDTGYNGFQFDALPITIRAQAAPGYRFAGWKGRPESSSDTLQLRMYGDSLVVALFERNGETLLPPRISTDLTLSAAESPFASSGDVVVEAGARLTVEAGCEIRMAEASSLIVHGSVDFQGNALGSIQVVPHVASGAESWGAIIFESADNTSELNGLRLLKASAGTNAQRHKAAISIYDSEVNMDACDITEVLAQPIFTQSSDVRLSNSYLYSAVTGDLINCKEGTASIENCDFRGNAQVDTDAIDYDGLSSGSIAHSKIYGFYGPNSDAIDLGEGAENIIIHDNFISDCTDKGISVGQASEIEAVNNVIVACDLGIGVKDADSYAYLHQNSFYGNRIAVAVFEKNEGSGGGRVDVHNCILAASSETATFHDTRSTLQVSWSLSDTGPLLGTGNLQGNPLFARPALNNFELIAGSPAINSGDPNTAHDPDSSRSDMGAHYAHTGLTSLGGLHINEFMAGNTNGITDESGDFADWIEIYNENDEAIDIGGMYLTDSLAAPFRWRLPEDVPAETRVPAKGFLLLWADQDTLAGAQHLGFRLGLDGEAIGLLAVEAGDTLWLDSLSFGRQWPNVSRGRYSDGGTRLRAFVAESPGASNALNAPIFSSAPVVSVSVDSLYTYAVSAEDRDGDDLSLTATGLPNWLSFVDLGNGSGMLSGVPGDSEVGAFHIDLWVSDGIYEEVLQEFDVVVTEFVPIEYVAPAISAQLYPNPVVGHAMVKLKGIHAARISYSIFDQSGQLLRSGTVPDEGSSNYRIDLEGLPAGFYFLRADIDGDHDSGSAEQSLILKMIKRED